MEKNKMQQAMNYAAVLGIYFLIKFFISVFAGQDTLLLSVSMVMTLIVPYIVYLIQKNYRDIKLDGTISYSSALLFGLYLFFYSSLILGLGQYIYYQFINPKFLENTFKTTIDELYNLGINEKLIDEAVKKGVSSPIITTFQNIVMNTFLGFFVVLITSAFVKKTDMFKSNND